MLSNSPDWRMLPHVHTHTHCTLTMDKKRECEGKLGREILQTLTLQIVNRLNEPFTDSHKITGQETPEN